MIKKKYTALLCCSEAVKSFILSECVREFKKHNPDMQDAHITHHMILTSMARNYTKKNIPNA